MPRAIDVPRYRVRYNATRIDGTQVAINVGDAATKEQATLYTLCHYLGNHEISKENKEKYLNRYKYSDIKLNDENWHEYSVWLASLDKPVNIKVISEAVSVEIESSALKSKEFIEDESIASFEDTFMEVEPLEHKSDEFIEQFDLDPLEDLELLKYLDDQDPQATQELKDEVFINPFDNDLEPLRKNTNTKAPKYSNYHNAKGKFEVRYSFQNEKGGGREYVTLGVVEGREKARLYSIIHALNNPDRPHKKVDDKKRLQVDKIMANAIVRNEYHTWLKNTATIKRMPRLSTSPSSSSSAASSPRISLPSLSAYKSEYDETVPYKYKDEDLDKYKDEDLDKYKDEDLNLVDDLDLVGNEALKVQFADPDLVKQEFNLFKRDLDLLDLDLNDKKALEVLFEIVLRISNNKTVSEPKGISKDEVLKYKRLLEAINKHHITAQRMEEYHKWKEKNSHATGAILRSFVYMRESEGFQPYRRALVAIDRSSITPQMIKEYLKLAQKQKRSDSDRSEPPPSKRPRLQ